MTRLLKKKIFMTFVKEQWVDFVQDHHEKYRDNCNEVLQSEKDIGFNFEYKKKWGFVAKVQGETQWIKYF